MKNIKVETWLNQIESWTLIFFLGRAAPNILLMVQLHKLKIPQLFHGNLFCLDGPQSDNQELNQLSWNSLLLEPFEANFDIFCNFFTIENVIYCFDIFHYLLR